MLFDRILSDQNTQTPLPASKLYDITPTIAVKLVPPSEYPQTTTAQSKLFSKHKFGNNVTTNRDTLKCVKILLAECSQLLTARERNLYIRMIISLNLDF
jgi:hypothetical protein